METWVVEAFFRKRMVYVYYLTAAPTEEEAVSNVAQESGSGAELKATNMIQILSGRTAACLYIRNTLRTPKSRP